MNPTELSKLLKWADAATRQLYFAFGIADGEGVLILDRNRKGKSILHDLVNLEGHRELKSRRFGTVSVSSAAATVTFMPNKQFDFAGRGLLQQILKKTALKGVAVVFAKAEAGEEDGGE